jgi:hypothetical protein
MEGIVRAVTEHPIVAMGVSFVVLLTVYFLFKSLLKLVLILILVAVAIGGYLYFQHPESRPANIGDAVEKARTGAGRALDRGKDAFEKGKKLVDKGKTFLDQGIDKGKDVVEKGRGTAGDLGKFPGGNKAGGDRQKP